MEQVILNLKKTISAGGIVRKAVNGRCYIVLTKEEERPDWLLPKGHQEKGETIEQAALREVKEETGLENIRIIKKLGVKQRVSFQGDEYKTIHYFLFDCDEAICPEEELPAVRDNEKTIIPRWFPIDKLPNLFWLEQKELIIENLTAIEKFKV